MKLLQLLICLFRLTAKALKLSLMLQDRLQFGVEFIGLRRVIMVVVIVVMAMAVVVAAPGQLPPNVVEAEQEERAPGNPREPNPDLVAEGIAEPGDQEAQQGGEPGRSGRRAASAWESPRAGRPR